MEKLNGSGWQPTPEAVERKAQECQKAACGTGCDWSKTAPYRADEHRAVARQWLIEQHEREAPLVGALDAAEFAIGRWYGNMWPETLAVVREALAAHAALDAPPKPEPTLAEVAARIVDGYHDDTAKVGIDAADFKALAAAVARERGEVAE